MEVLGAKCAQCHTTENLTFDCMVPQGHSHHGWSTDKRMTFYRSQHARRNLQILCMSCNGFKGNGHDVEFHRRAPLPYQGNTPF